MNSFGVNLIRRHKLTWIENNLKSYVNSNYHVNTVSFKVLNWHQNMIKIWWMRFRKNPRVRECVNVNNFIDKIDDTLSQHRNRWWISSNRKTLIEEKQTLNVGSDEMKLQRRVSQDFGLSYFYVSVSMSQ